jgi:hypothetical protein
MRHIINNGKLEKVKFVYINCWEINTMTRRVFLSILIVFFTITIVGCNFQNLTKEQYELQDKCEKQCEIWSKSYQQKYPGDKFTYKDHYNKRLNKCFILVKYSKSQLKSLRNINENKIYGSFFSKQDSKTVICNVLEKKCNSEAEWDSLVKPYIEE